MCSTIRWKVCSFYCAVLPIILYYLHQFLYFQDGRWRKETVTDHNENHINIAQDKDLVNYSNDKYIVGNQWI